MAFNNFKNKRGNAFPNVGFTPGGDGNLDDLRGVKKETTMIPTEESEAPEGFPQPKLNIDTFYQMESEYGKFKRGKKFDDPSLKESQRKMADYAYKYNNSPQCPDGDCIGYDDLGYFGSKLLEKLQANRKQ